MTLTRRPAPRHVASAVRVRLPVRVTRGVETRSGGHDLSSNSLVFVTRFAASAFVFCRCSFAQATAIVAAFCELGFSGCDEQFGILVKTCRLCIFPHGWIYRLGFLT